MTDNKFSHQNWDPIVINRKPKAIINNNPTKSTKKPHNTSQVTVSNKNVTALPRNIVNDFDPENMIKPATSTGELARAIQNARTAKNMKQTDLDNACSFPKNTVRDYEKGTAKINHLQINKMETVLGVTLPRM